LGLDSAFAVYKGRGLSYMPAQMIRERVSANFAMLIRRCRIRYKVSALDMPCSIHLSRCIHAKPSAPCPCEKRIVVAHLEHQRSTLGLLVTTMRLLASPLRNHAVWTYPSSKCLHRFSANCDFVLHTVHSNLNTTFFVVLAFLWNTGFV
jgi:hypothetical protein